MHAYSALGGKSLGWAGHAHHRPLYPYPPCSRRYDTSKDAALIATLAPGSYSLVVTGVGNTTGLGLVEGYVLP